MCEHHNETARPPETVLTFPSKGRELDIFFGPVVDKTRNDGGAFIPEMDEFVVSRLFDEVATAKADLARKLGTDADGRLWLELTARDYESAINSDESRARAGQFLCRLTSALLDMSRAACDRGREYMVQWLNVDEAKHGRLLDAFIRDMKAPEGEYQTVLGGSLDRLYRLAYHHIDAEDDSVLDLLSSLPVVAPDAEGKVKRSVRTAKWLKKYQPLVVAWRGSEYYGDDIDAQMSRILDALATQRVHVCVSVNPLDFLLSATRQVCDFTSCHSLDGMHAHGNVSYARDGFTALVFLDREGGSRGFPFFKTGRCWAYFGEQDQILFGQLYGRGFTAPVVQEALRLLEARVRPGERWRARNRVTVDWDKISGIGGYGSPQTHTYYPGFLDATLTRMAAPLSLLRSETARLELQEDDEEVVERSFKKLRDVFPVLAFKPALCLACGDDIDRSSGRDHTESPFCTECDTDPRYRCAGCGDGIDEDEAYRHHGDYYCESCYESEFFTCEHCEQVMPSDTARTVDRVRFTRWGYDAAPVVRSEDATICGGCYDDEAHYCINHRAYVILGRNLEMIEVGDDLVCPLPGCAASVMECDDCGEHYHDDEECPDASQHAADAQRAEEAAQDQAAIIRLDGESPATVTHTATTQEVTHV